jgi:hypothetical protein
MMVATTEHTQVSRSTPPLTLRVGLSAALLATGSNVMVFALGRTSGVPFLVAGQGGAGPAHVTLAHVVVATLATMAVGTVVAALAVRRSPRLLRTVLVAGVVIAVASAAAPLTMGLGIATRLLLASMHLVAGFGLAAALWPNRRREPLPRQTGN